MPNRRSDPRGPERTIKTVELTPQAALVTFAECGHVGRKNRAMTHRPGDRDRCFACREAR